MAGVRRLAVAAALTPFDAGQAAYHLGYSRDACPYGKGNLAAAEWQEGWDEESGESESGAGGDAHPAGAGG